MALYVFVIGDKMGGYDKSHRRTQGDEYGHGALGQDVRIYPPTAGELDVMSEHSPLDRDPESQLAIRVAGPSVVGEDLRLARRVVHKELIRQPEPQAEPRTQLAQALDMILGL